MRTMQISGNLGRDAELTQTNNGLDMATFSIAVRQSRKNDDGQYGSDWVDCVVFGSRATTVHNYFKKGGQVTVGGEWSLNNYTSNNGESQTTLQLNVATFDLPKRQSEPSSTDPFSDNSFQKSFEHNDTKTLNDTDLPF